LRDTIQRAALSTTTSSQAHLIINVVGEDRLGIVSDIAGLVIGAGGNVGDSQAAKLGSHFSLMMVVSVPRTSLDELREQLAGMSDMNAAVFEADGKEVPTPQIGCTYCTHACMHACLQI
jgi:glycine cleavage system transcriptional repressor